KTAKEKARRPKRSVLSGNSAKLSLGVMIDTRRRRHSRKIVQVLAGVFVALHVARRAGEQLFRVFAIDWKTSNANADVHGGRLAGPHRKLMRGNCAANSLRHAFGHHLRS